MEARPVISTVRQLIRCVKMKQQALLPTSAPASKLCYQARSSDCVLHPSPRHFSTTITTIPIISRRSSSSSSRDVLSLWTSVSPESGGGVARCVGSVRGMAGHSKWANIRHIKAAKDKEKSRVIHEYTKKLRALVKECRETDPKKNSQLAKLIAEAKSRNVPNANMDRVLRQMSSLKNVAPVTLSAKGPRGSVMLIEVHTDKMPQTKMELQSIVKKCGFSMYESKSYAQHVFEEKGVVEVYPPEGSPPDLDSHTDMAIEAGAEDVTLEEDEQGNHFFQFTCNADDFNAVLKALEAQELDIRFAEVVVNATTTVALDSQMVGLVAKAMEKLEDHADVVKVFNNVEEASS